MRARVYDISVPVGPSTVVWPGAPSAVVERRLSIANGDPVNDSNLFMNVHTGTHIDAPLHHFDDGEDAAEAGLDVLLGEAWVVSIPSADLITTELLRNAWPDRVVDRVLFHTKNSALWDRAPNFTGSYCSLTSDAAAWLVDHGVRLVGIDYLSVQAFADPPDVHQILLRARVVIVEGLNLTGVPSGKFELLCLPLRLPNVEGAPARVVLRELVDA